VNEGAESPANDWDGRGGKRLRHNLPMTLKVLLEQDENGFVVAHVPALRGCVSQGRTRQEALDNIKEAIQGWLEVERDKRPA
jgi:predicted RNase H-like HicB family nuclease